MGILTLHVNGTDLETFGWIEEASAMLPLPAVRGSNLTVGQRPGAGFIDKVTDVSVYTVVLVLGAADANASEGDLLGKIRDIRRLLFSPDAPLTLTRSIAYNDGTVTADGLAECLPSQPARLSPGYARWALDFQLLEGGFYGPQQSTTLTSGGSTTVDNTGDDRTRKVTLAFSGGGPYVLTNTTTGRVLNVPAGTVTVDVWTPTVTSGGLSVLGSTSKSGDAAEAFLFALAKDNNSLSLSGGGQVVVSWQPVYL